MHGLSETGEGSCAKEYPREKVPSDGSGWKEGFSTLGRGNGSRKLRQKVPSRKGTLEKVPSDGSGVPGGRRGSVHSDRADRGNVSKLPAQGQAAIGRWAAGGDDGNQAEVREAVAFVGAPGCPRSIDDVVNSSNGYG